MLSKSRKNFFEILCSVCITLCVLPGYQLLGNLMAQVFASAFCCFILLIIFDFLKIKPHIIAHSLVVMTVFWIGVALFKQVSLHLASKDYTFEWIHLFYYDRPAMLFVVMFTCLIYFIVKLIIKQNDQKYITDYSKFIKITTVCFIVYYIIILIYCFILVRDITFTRPTPNLVPFKMIIGTFSLGRIDYELFFLFLGNIAIFLPLGVFISALTRNKIFLAVFPLVLSVSIEISQYLLGNGHPDVDDVILNILGFYLGIFIKIGIDYILFKASKGKFKSFFIFS